MDYLGVRQEDRHGVQSAAVQDEASYRSALLPRMFLLPMPVKRVSGRRTCSLPRESQKHAPLDADSDYIYCQYKDPVTKAQPCKQVLKRTLHIPLCLNHRRLRRMFDCAAHAVCAFADKCSPSWFSRQRPGLA